MNVRTPFEALEKSSVVGVFIYQEKGRIAYVNDTVAKLLGYSREELLNTCIVDYVVGSKDYIQEKEEQVRMRTKGNQFTYENKSHLFKAKNGSVIPVAVFAYTIEYNNKPSGFVMVIDKTQEESAKNLFFALSQINQLIVRENNQNSLLQSICNILVDKVGYLATSIGKVEEPEKLYNIQYITAKNNEIKEALLNTPISVDENKPYGRGSVSKAYNTGEVAVIPEVASNNDFSYWSDAYKAYNVHSVCSIPIKKFGKLEYIIYIASNSSNNFSDIYRHLLEEMRGDIEFALEKIENNRYNDMMLTALNTGLDFVVITDKNFNIVYVNKAAENLTGYSKEELIGRHHSIFSSKTHSEKLTLQLYRTLREGKIFHSPMTYKVKDGSLINAAVTIVPFRIEGNVEYYIAVGEDITEKEELYERLNTLINYDNLTGLINRASFIKSIKHFTDRAEFENLIGAVAVINPINFKNINHAFGFETGNLVLKEIAKRLKKSLKKYDIVARLEADKFGVLIEKMNSELDITIVVTNLLNALKELYNIGREKISITFNVGVSIYPRNGLKAFELLNKANIALMDAKKKGENSVGFFEKSLEETVFKRVKLRADLNLAISNKEFMVYYQPYVDRNRKIAGAEALLRWKKGDRTVLPLEFIPLLEQTELIAKVEQYVLSTVLQEIKRIKQLDITPVKMSLNLSEKSFYQPDLSEIVISEMDRLNIEKDLLNIEIVERILVDNFIYVKNIIQTLRKHSIGFSLDDFGTGYSSLFYLSQLPINYLKIDISFVREILNNAKTRNITESAVNLARKLNIKTVAEGVESVEQFEILKSFGCDYFQGYLFSKPVAVEKFEKLLKKKIL